MFLREMGENRPMPGSYTIRRLSTISGGQGAPTPEASGQCYACFECANCGFMALIDKEAEGVILHLAGSVCESAQARTSAPVNRLYWAAALPRPGWCCPQLGLCVCLQELEVQTLPIRQGVAGVHGELRLLGDTRDYGAVNGP